MGTLKIDNELKGVAKNFAGFATWAYLDANRFSALNDVRTVYASYDVSDRNLDLDDYVILNLRKVLPLIENDTKIEFEDNKIVVSNGKINVELSHVLKNDDKNLVKDGRDIIKDSKELASFDIDFREFKKFLNVVSYLNLNVVLFSGKDGKIVATGYNSDLNEYDKVKLDICDYDGNDFEIGFLVENFVFIPDKYKVSILDNNGLYILKAENGKLFYLVAAFIER